MKPKRTVKYIKGVMLKDILDKAVIDVSLKLLSEIYITCIASDNYKVVFSWNEIYNSPIGEKIMILTEADKKKGKSNARQDCFVICCGPCNRPALCGRTAKILIEQVK